MKDKEKQYISMKEMLTKRSFGTITNCNYRQYKEGAFVDLLNQEMEELQREKQIEEMAKVIKNSLSLHIEKTIIYPYIAQDLYACGYRKLPENAVVLSMEEAERFRGQTINIAKVKAQARKETAKEILILLGKGFDETKMTEFKNLPWYKLFYEELKQRYGVEVEE